MKESLKPIEVINEFEFIYNMERIKITTDKQEKAYKKRWNLSHDTHVM